ncbi:polyprenol monophosphomannose synthase [Okibacterium endophyticum]
MKPLVIVPTYNEATNIRHTLDEISIWLPQADIMVVDDGSPDGTGEMVSEHAAENTRVSLLRRERKTGLGSAYRAGFAAALERGYDVVIEMDADGSHPAESLPTLVAALDRADLVLGSRWVPGGSTSGWGINRVVLSRGASWYARAMLRSSVRDMTSGFRAFRADTLRMIDVGTTTTNGYCFQIETLHRAERMGLTVSEIPIVFSERASGHSKMSRQIIVEAAVQVWRWRRSRRRDAGTERGRERTASAAG